jgi:hypothetical protein
VSTLIDAGTNPTIPVATKSLGGAIYQLTTPMRRGSSDYDSGVVAIAAGNPAVVTASTIYPEGGCVVNTGDTAILATLTNTAGDVFFRKRVEGGDTVPIHVSPGFSLVGVKAGADIAGLNLAIWGAQ